MSEPNPVLQFNPTFRQLVNNVYHLVTLDMEEPLDPDGTLDLDLEEMADDLGTSAYWVEKAWAWLDRYGPFPEEGKSSKEVK